MPAGGGAAPTESAPPRLLRANTWSPPSRLRAVLRQNPTSDSGVWLPRPHLRTHAYRHTRVRAHTHLFISSFDKVSVHFYLIDGLIDLKHPICSDYSNSEKC